MLLKAYLLPALWWVLLVIGGCASVAPRPSVRAAPFDVLGRVLVSYEGRSFSASVRWMHAADADEIWLMTPTGQALAHLREDGEGATLTSADKSQYRAANVETLTRRALGWELPMTRLQHWLRGAPAPDSAAPAAITERDAAGKIRQFSQDDWRISYDYFLPADNGGLPRRLELEGATQKIRLVIDSWRREAQDVVSAPAAQ